MNEIRPLFEFGVPICNSGLNKAHVREIEIVQKVALQIILDESYISYNVACTLMSTLPLEHPRYDLSTTFVIKLYKSPISSEIFETNKNCVNARSRPSKRRDPGI